ncbi:MAG: TMEM175 family protein [Myxococcota bacterium]|nr:TMEM175 family protein [Myxococcota bacterium]
MTQAAVAAREKRQLARLEVLVDSIYAVVIVLLVYLFPTPRDVGWEAGSVWAFLASQRDDLLISALGLGLVISYWIRSNVAFGNLVRTDNRHASLAIVQVLFLLFYLYAMGISMELGEEPGSLALQSAALVLMGLTALYGWRYATREGRLTAEELSAAEVDEIRTGMLPEPITAALTLAVSPLGIDAWTLAWLAFPVLAWGLRRRQRRRAP